MSSEALSKSESTVPPIRFEYRNGILLSRVRLHLIYWGAHWRTAQHPSREDIAEAMRKMTSPGGYLSGLAQYNRGREPVVELVETRYDLDLENPAKALQDDGDGSDIVAEVKSLMGPIERDLPHQPEAQPFYLVVLPPGVTCTTEDADGEVLAGEHGWFVKDGHRRVYYGWVLHGTIQRMTVAISEELVEAITDPEPPCCDDALAGWVMQDNQGDFQEVCDVCAGITANVDGVHVQTYFSNEKMDCIAPPEIPNERLFC
jgi:hypothetical protein